MKRNVKCVIMGGGRGARLYPLTKFRCKPAVPLGGKYRLVDIPISNCLNAGLTQIYVLTQFNTASLHRHIHESYRFDGFGGGFVDILSAEQTEDDENWYQGTADAVRQNLRHIPMDDDSLVLILSGDQLYRMDFTELLNHHQNSGAPLTIAAKAMPERNASSLGIMRIDDHSEILEFVEKPKDPTVIENFILNDKWRKTLKDVSDTRYCLASMGIYVFNASFLKACLEGGTRASDFGKDILPSLVGKERMSAFIFDDYWEDIGTVAAFFEANLMLTDVIPAFNFYDENSPIYTRARHLPGSKLNSCRVEHSIVSDGCIISDALLRRCVIGARSIIRKGSQLENVLMMGADHYESDEHATPEMPAIGIGYNCEIRNAIVDRNARIGNNVRLSPEGKPDTFQHYGIYVRDKVLCIVRDAVVPDNTIL